MAKKVGHSVLPIQPDAAQVLPSKSQSAKMEVEDQTLPKTECYETIQSGQVTYNKMPLKCGRALLPHSHSVTTTAVFL